MVEFTRTLARDVGYTGSDAHLRAFPVRSSDPMVLTRTAHDWIFDTGFAAGYADGALPAAGTALVAGGLNNLANDSPAALPVAMRGAVTLKSGAGNPATITATGGILSLRQTLGGTYSPTMVQKAGVADADVAHPPAEGFKDFLAIVWMQKVGEPTSGNMDGLIGQANGNLFWGLRSAPGFIVEQQINRYIPLAPGGWHQLAVHYRFAGDAIYVRTWLDGRESGVEAAAGQTMTAMAAQSRAGALCSVACDAYWRNATTVVARAERIFTAIAGHTLDPNQEVRRNWAALHGRFGL